MTRRNKILEKIKKGVIPFFIITLSGCAADLPFYERSFTSDGKQIVARKNGVEVQVLKNGTFWEIYYINKHKNSKCVKTTWKLFDLFKNMPDGLTYIKSNTSMRVGFFAEQSWKFDKLDILIGGSGYVEDFYVITPYKEREDCLFPQGEIS